MARHPWKWGTQEYVTGVYHPRANPVERRNQEIKKGLRINLQDKPHNEWAQQLYLVLRDLQTRRNAATGYSPALALLGYKLRIPGDWDLRPGEPVEAPEHAGRRQRIEYIRERQLTYTRRYDGGTAEEQYNVGDPVMIRAHPQSSKKRKIHDGFLPKWLGPYNIRELHEGRVYTVVRDGHAVRVPQYDVLPSRRPPLTPPAHGSDREDEEPRLGPSTRTTRPGSPQAGRRQPRGPRGCSGGAQQPPEKPQPGPRCSLRRAPSRQAKPATQAPAEPRDDPGQAQQPSGKPQRGPSSSMKRVPLRQPKPAQQTADDRGDSPSRAQSQEPPPRGSRYTRRRGRQLSKPKGSHSPCQGLAGNVRKKNLSKLNI